MDGNQARVGQEFIDQTNIVELIMSKQQAFELVAMVASQSSIMVPGKELFVMHFMCHKKQSPSALWGKLMTSKIQHIAHFQRVAGSEEIIPTIDELQMEELAVWLDIVYS